MTEERIKKNIAKNITVLRMAKGMTQAELADALGISFQAVSNWERGNSMPDISKLPELAEIFGVTIDDIIGHNNTVLHDVISSQSPNANEYKINPAPKIAPPEKPPGSCRFDSRRLFPD